MRLTGIFKAKTKEMEMEVPAPGTYREPYRYKPPREANFLDNKKSLPQKLHQLTYISLRKLAKNHKQPKPIENSLLYPEFPIVQKYEVAEAIKTEHVKYVKKRHSNTSFMGKAEKVFKSLSDDVSYYCKRSVNFLTLYNLRQEGLIGIDITPHCIYLCQIDGVNGKRVLTSLTSVCMEGKFLNKDISDNPNDYADSLKTLIKGNNIKTKNVALSIPVSNSIVKTVTIPAMDDAEIQKALRFGSLWNNLMSPKHNPEDYSIFYQVIRRKKSQETMDVLFVATKLSDVSLYTDIVKNSGLNPVIVDVRCFAISNAFNHKRNMPEISGPNVFLEFGPQENYAMIIDGDSAHVFDIHISDAHRKSLTENMMDSETMMSFVANYSTQVRNTIAEYESKHRTNMVKNIFVLSAIPMANTIIDNLSKLLEEYAISHCNFFDCMNIKDDFTIGAKSAKQTMSAWAGCIGTALRKINILGSDSSDAQYKTNMLPNPHLYAKEKRIKYALNCACLAASIALVCFVVTTQRELNLENQELSRQLALLDGIQENYNASLAKHNQLAFATGHVDLIESLKDEAGINQKKLITLHQYLGMVLVDNVWLKEMTFSAPNHVEIRGAATDDKSILSFMNLLNEGKQFDKIALKGMQEVHEMAYGDYYSSTIKNFTINGTIAANPPPLETIAPTEPVAAGAPEPMPVDLVAGNGGGAGTL